MSDTKPAALAATAPDAGWKLVPVEPTSEMLKAAGRYADHCAVHNYGGPPDAEGAWDAMLAAAPLAPATPVSEAGGEIERLRTALRNVRHAILEGAKGEDAVVTCTLWMPGEMIAETVVDHINAALGESHD